jgi:tRNA pseudouridine55 synthase
MRPVDGVLLIDKPPGPSSHDVVAAVRRTLPRTPEGRRERVGHAGTLDPFATGLLLVLVGRATRVQRLLMNLPKRYETVARLGALSSTGDPEGAITETGRLPADPPVLPRGPLRQRPPIYSAVKVDGERAYARARRGEAFELAEREITVHRFEQRWRRGDRAAYEIECSTGTYVRSLIADLGDAYCLSLRRTAIGPFLVDDAQPPPGRDAAGPPPTALDLEQALAFLPRLYLEGEAARVAAHGVAVAPERGRWEGPEPAGGASVLILDGDGAVAVAETREGASGPELKPVVGFRG